MPMIAPLIPIISAFAGAASAGLGIYETVHAGNVQSDQEKKMKLAQEQADAKAAQQRSDEAKKLIAGNLPSAVSQTGGYLTSTGDLGLAGALSGLPGAPYSGAGQGALTQFLGAPGGSGGKDESPDMLTALHQLGIGSSPGGAPGSPQGPEPNMMQQVYGISGSSA